MSTRHDRGAEDGATAARECRWPRLAWEPPHLRTNAISYIGQVEQRS